MATDTGRKLSRDGLKLVDNVMIFEIAGNGGLVDQPKKTRPKCDKSNFDLDIWPSEKTVRHVVLDVSHQRLMSFWHI